ncbi:MAG: nucleotidyltransferase domain-containing protein [Firmicutes bacterium]|nr:nucleotidyltransferase domain-containing protein [Bacillota bacterium]
MREVITETVQEGAKFHRLNYPDPLGCGDEFRPVFPPRHRALKAVLDNLPESVDKVYVFGSSIRWDSAVNSDLDLLLIGNPTNAEMNALYRSIPEGEKADILTETEEAFMKGVADGWSLLYRKIY